MNSSDASDPPIEPNEEKARVPTASAFFQAAVDEQYRLDEASAKRFAEREVWELETAVSLSLGQKPDARSVSLSFTPVFNEDKELARRVEWGKYVQTVAESGRLKFPIEPSTFLAWAQDTASQHLCSQEAVRLLVSYLPTDVPTREQLQQQIAELEKLYGHRATSLRTKQNLQMCVFVAAAMAVQGEKAKNKLRVSDLIEDGIEIIGRKLSSGSVQGYISEAEDFLGISFNLAIDMLSEVSADKSAAIPAAKRLKPPLD